MSYTLANGLHNADPGDRLYCGGGTHYRLL